MLGVVDAATVPVLRPGFLEHAVSENVYAGGAMLRRGMCHTGMGLRTGATGTLGAGLGPSTSQGTVGLIAPTLDVTATGQQETFDGVDIVFQITPGTEAPAEMNFYFPQRHALCMAENATHNLHNLLTLRGAEVRDARGWSRYLAEAIELFAHDAVVAFASHHWPTWESANIIRFLTEQRDTYAYLHDQTLRRLNQGLVGSEIAEDFPMPPALDAAWHTHGYYGSVSHNVKAIYQRYLGWYDGNPAHLWQHPPEAAAARYVQAIGGIGATVARAQEFADSDDLRFAAELASHAVFAEPDHAGAPRHCSARVFTRLGYGSECGTGANTSSPEHKNSRARNARRRQLSGWHRLTITSSSIASPSASTADAPGTPPHRSAGTSATRPRRTGWSCPTASSLITRPAGPRTQTS